MLRFTIRDLLWLMALIAISLGWWLDHRTSTRRFAVMEEDRDKFHFAAQALRTHLMQAQQASDGFQKQLHPELAEALNKWREEGRQRAKEQESYWDKVKP